ncbi:MAG: alpha/beta fold hydrolase [Candidatus Omnitrophota bacterium]
MKKIYITVICLFAASIVIFISSFVYLDKNKRKTYYYVINSSGRDIGIIKVDKFVTEDKLIYKTAALVPYGEIITENRSKIVYDRKYNLESYAAERTANGAVETISVEKKGGGVSFVSRLNSCFAFLEDIPTRKETFIFEENSPATYLPIIENYDFARGRSQGFSAISCFMDWELPPMKRFVTLTSIRDEYLKIGRKKIKTENLLLKIKNYPQGSVWVAKIDRSLIKIEMPAVALKITRTFSPWELTSKNYIGRSKDYTSRDIAFKNNGVNLSGTLTFPLKEGKYPAVLLAGPDGPEDRNLRGLFADLAETLSRNGLTVLRFDKRGVGSSDGSLASLSEDEETDDLARALDLLAAQKEADPQSLFILGHSRGCFRALKLASEKNYIKGLILMAPEIYSRYGAKENFENYDKIFFDKKWGQDYLKSVKKSLEEIKDRASRSKGNWAFILWKRCFVKRVKEEMNRIPSLFIKNVKVPVLILQGRQDSPSSMESSFLLDRMLEDGGNISHALTYYGYLGRYFGKKVNDGIYKIHYAADKDVLDNIINWIAKMAAAPQETSPQTA